MSFQRLAYTTDLTDDEWQILEPLLLPEKSGGRPRTYPRREVVNGLQYVRRGGGAWRLMPHDRPHGQTASQTFRAWRQDGPWRRLHDHRRDEVRGRMGRAPHPSGAILEAPTVKPTDTGGPTAMTARRRFMAARAIGSWRRRVSCDASSSMPPT
jgi:putative transposase